MIIEQEPVTLSKKPEILELKNIPIPEGTLIFMVGLPGSGKSTFAREHFPEEYIASADYERQALTNNPANQTSNEEAFKIIHRITISRLKHGKSVVIDAQNLDQKGRESFEEIAATLKRPVIVIHLDTDFDEIYRRDAERMKAVGRDYLASRVGKYKEDRRSLESDRKIDRIYRLTDTHDVTVSLPEVDQAKIEDERQFYEITHVSEVDLFDYITRQMEAESRNETPENPRLVVEPGSTNFLPDTDAANEFLKNNLLPSQIISPAWIARQMEATVNDTSVKAVIDILIKNREANNLITFVIYPPEFSGQVTKLASDNPLRQSITVPEETLAKSLIEINDRSEELPLLILGDIHGCYTALRTHANNVLIENFDLPPSQKRRMLFVGDIADRGPYNAEAIIYVASLVRQREAVLIAGNHDRNLTLGMKEILAQAKTQLATGLTWEQFVLNFDFESLREIVRSSDTRESLSQLLVKIGTDGHRSVRLKRSSLEKIFEVFDSAPLYKEYKHLVAVHASLRRIPRREEVIPYNEQKEMTHGIRSFTAVWTGRAEVKAMHEVVAKDPRKIVASGHTHRQQVEMRPLTGSVNLDVDGGNRGYIYGLRWGGAGHLQVVSEQEPTLIKLYEQLNSGELPRGQELVRFLHYLHTQDMIEMKSGAPGTIFEDLTVISYSQITELQSLWEKYPVLRNFRGLIVDKEGNIVARPFNKTHKAGIEIPLEKLDIIPDKVFEKANGSMGICYFWQGEWHIATKFSFDNEGYTKPAMAMLDSMNTQSLDPANTYLFEIILPEDSHIVDYHGERQLVLLNARDKETGQEMSWEVVKQTAAGLGCRTAIDMTEQVKGMTIAQLYRHAQKLGSFHNLEGLMAQYHDPVTHEKITVKVKTIEYDNRKYVRDRLDWEKLLDNFDWDFAKPGMSPEIIDKILTYNRDNEFAQMAIAARTAWITQEYIKYVKEVQEVIFGPWQAAEKVYIERIAAGAPVAKAQETATNVAIKEILALFDSGQTGVAKEFQGPIIGFMRAILFTEPGTAASSEAYNRLSGSAKERIKQIIAQETKKRGHSAYWLIPSP